MSTYMYLRCLDHDPPLVAEDESGQHQYDLSRIRQEIRDRDFLVRAMDEWGSVPGDFFTQNSARFLHRHRACRIDITDEYGVNHPTEEPS